MLSVVVVVDRRSSLSHHWSLVVGLCGLISPLSVFIVSLSISCQSSSSPHLLAGRSSVIVAFLSHLSSLHCRSCRLSVFSLHCHRVSSLCRIVGRHRSSLSCQLSVIITLSFSCRFIGLCRSSVFVVLLSIHHGLCLASLVSHQSSSVFIVCQCRPRSSSVMLLSGVHWSLSESIIDCRLWLPVGVRCLWSSIVCGCPSPVRVHCLWSSVQGTLPILVTKCQ